MTRQTKALMAALLNRQIDNATEAELEDAAPRWRAYARGAPWTPEDKRLVWTSPSARSAYLAARREMIQELTGAWSAGGFTREMGLSPTGGGDDDRIVVSAGVSISVVSSAALGGWMITLELTDDAFKLIPSGVTLRVQDEDGRVWVEGVPDELGGIDAYWRDTAETPMERLIGRKLILEFC